MNTQTKFPSLSQRMPCLNPIYPTQYDQLFLQIKHKIQQQQYTSQLNQQIQKLLTFGQSNYTCWVAKKKILQHNNTTIQHEDKYSQQLLFDNLKNFQIWDYRNFIYDNTHNHIREYQLMDKILEQSPKNYHLWSNRTRLVSLVQNYGEEISRTEKFIEKDGYNNSVWAYRAFCYSRVPVKDYQTEFQYVLGKIKKNIDNQAAWNYLRGYFPCYKLKTLPSAHPHHLLQYKDYPIIRAVCKQIIDNKQIKQHLKIQVLITLIIIDSHSEQTVHYAKQICGYLAELEPIRGNYYKWLAGAL